MLKLLPATKIGMTTALEDEGNAVPVTILQPAKVYITQIKRPATDGYCAVQVAYGDSRAKLVNKPLRGVLNKAGVKGDHRHFYEWRCAEADLAEFTLGQEIDPREFMRHWDAIEVCGTSKGKGFAGAMKRWGFKGQARSHGDTGSRRPQSNGATDAARVFKGSRRPGRMGNAQVTLKGLTVFDYDPEINVLAVSGSVPGPTGGLLFVRMITERTPEDLAELEGGDGNA